MLSFNIKIKAVFQKILILKLQFLWSAILLLILSPAATVHAEVSTNTVLFDGSLGKQWNELAALGGNFKKFARIENEMLLIEIPQEITKGKTGIRSAESVVKIPERKAKFSEKITFSFDATRTSDFILAIIPANWDGNLEWRSHHIRVELQSKKNGTNSLLTLWIKGREVMKISLYPESIKQLSIEMRPDQLILVKDGSGEILLQEFLPDSLPIFKKGYRISVLAQAKRKDMPASKLALKTITLEQQPFKGKNPEDDVSSLLADSQKTVLFDGRILNKRWIKYQLHKGSSFSNHARFVNGALLVDVPKGIGWGKAGIMSPEPLVWLDKFGDGAKVQVSFKFDPDQTTGFVIALSAAEALKGNAPRRPNLYLHWRYDKERNIKAELFINDKLVKTLNSVAQAPELLNFILSPNGLQIEGLGSTNEVIPWNMLKPSQGFQLYVFSHPDKYKEPVKVALKQILIERQSGLPTSLPRPSEGVASLPVHELFSGANREGWELTPWPTIKKKPLDLCSLGETGFGVSAVPKGTPLDGCDIHSIKPTINIDKRIDSANYQITAQFDPDKTKNFIITVTPQKRQFWKKYYKVCYLSLLQSEARENVFSFNCGAKKYWKRSVSSEWLKTKWNGKVNVLVGKNWMQGGLEGGTKILINKVFLGKVFVSIVAPDYHNKATSAEFLLSKLTGQWIAPEGMTTVDRWSYLDLDAFNPKGFLKDIKSELEAIDN